ncbi:hypothetical protein TSUD_244240 [Trifolium subterraneum]|uniref:Uncharacterized protein n=1 Tax=Trifolium subterraneum TaxID=3900 RepID=A0A2Z6PHQ4_TRISU|nr:hypothetical protein TSUD_244240 [Trifolium subterraneum]
MHVFRFHYMVVADNRQRLMPLPDDRLSGRGEELVPPEAVLLVNPVEPEFKGEEVGWRAAINNKFSVTWSRC